MPFRDVSLAVLVVFVWGVNFVAIKIGVQDVPPLLLTALRFFFTALPAVFFIRRPAVAWSSLAAFGILLGVIKFGLIFSAVKLGMPAGLTSLVMQVQVFLTMALAFLLLGERPTPLQVLGAAIGFAGIGIVAIERFHGATFMPFLMLMGGALSWAFANMVIKKAGRVNMLAFLVWASLFAPAPLFLASLAFEGWPAIEASLSPPSLASVLSLAFIVLPSTLFGFAVWNDLLQRYSTAMVTPFALLVPVFGLFSGTILLDEPFSLLAMIGSAVVFAGLMINVFGDRLGRVRPALR
ncbi:MAG: EamA family transporter [Beijerinckiaceae bacterium]|nr:EamA family transporter [Beijerinckiaceae bacterium]